MKWDIDKALATYAAPGALLEHSIARVLIPREQWRHHKINPKLDKDSKADAILCWSLGVGRWGQPKLFSIALTLRECHLRMRKAILRLGEGDLTAYGLRARPVRLKVSRRDARRILKRYSAKKAAK